MLGKTQDDVSSGKARLRRTNTPMGMSMNPTAQQERADKLNKLLEKKEGLPPVGARRWMQELAPIFKSEGWNNLICVVVILNGICMAARVDAERGTWTDSLLHAAEHLFVLVFAAEAVLKAAVFGARAVMASNTLKFEFAIALIGAVDLWLIDFRKWGMGADDLGFNVLPLLRLIRFSSVFRHGELAMISRCFFPAFRTMLHVTLFTCLIVFIFAIPTTKLIGQNPIYDDNSQNVRVLYGTVPHCWYGLMQMAINPDIFMMQHLFEHQPWTAPFAMLFLAMTTYTTFGLVFGCVTDTYAEYADAEKQQKAAEEDVQNEVIRHGLLDQLREVDEKRGMHGTLDEAEFKKQVEAPAFQQALQKIGVDEVQCQEISESMTAEGHVHYEEFVSALGLVDKAAQAKSILWLRAHTAEDMNRFEKRMDKVEEQLAAYTTAFAQLEKNLTKRINDGFASLRA